MEKQHGFVELRAGSDQYGRQTVVWVCACGRKGKGSRTIPEAQAAFVKHARGVVRRRNAARAQRHPGLVTRVNAETCAALTAAFPLILITVTLSRRELHVKIRRLRGTRLVLQGAVAVCLLGLAWALVGINHDGWDGPNAFITWGFAVVAGLFLGYFIIAHHATAEIEEDESEDA